ncbi:DNase1 protein [Ophiocordyceps sinensis CO18]|uniref:DNase1 protein n=1 Tax=Ophiocordyceps sinensis (strain Co18 / CGMCC 3.14243) TaxID=911162 RepID=T5AKN5_OPHSC|nr:DNase1 protein [Ophiocordyceps sinensis CO18]
MHFATSAIALVALAAASQAATITFWTLDDAQRTVYFVGNPGSSQMPPTVVNSQRQRTVVFPDNWAGNFYAILDGHSNKPGMLGEVQFSGWRGKTYFDVSAIVDGADHTSRCGRQKANGLCLGARCFPATTATGFRTTFRPR